MSEAEIFLPNLAGGLGLGLGRKYAYLVLPTVLMPRGDFCPLGQVISHTSGGGFLYKEERLSLFQ